MTSTTAISSVNDAALHTLQRVFGYTQFRPGQQAIIDACLQGRDSLVLLPTGGGKSLCYQIPALLLPKVTIVVSPLISLMQDQVMALKQQGVAAEYISQLQTRDEVFQILSQLRQQQLKLLYVAPERVLQDDFLTRLQEVGVSLFAIDEAHCVSHWGHDFRPHYTELYRLKNCFPDVPMMALTATADRTTRQDIAQQLALVTPFVFTGSFDRPNIRYQLDEKFKPLSQLSQYLRSRRGQSGIIYCGSRRRVDDIAEKLSEYGFNCAAYHAGHSAEHRQFVQNRFSKDDIDIIVATVAFGMGINKPDVRFVIHVDLPKNIESYYQETGRAGRDGLPAEALLLYDPADSRRIAQLLSEIADENRRNVEEQRFAAMVAFAEAQTCRRQVLLNYFAEPSPKACGNCDICLNPPKQFDGLEVAQKALSCVYRIGQNMAMGHVIDVLRGSHNQKVKELGHDSLSTFGLGKQHPPQYWLSILRQLIHQGYLLQDIAVHSALKLTEAARGVLRGEQGLQLAVPRLNQQLAEQATSALYDKALFAKLKRLRKELADAADVPPFVVFNDATLQEMARLTPTDDRQFLQISGVGITKLSRYGSQFMALIREHLAA